MRTHEPKIDPRNNFYKPGKDESLRSMLLRQFREFTPTRIISEVISEEQEPFASSKFHRKLTHYDAVITVIDELSLNFPPIL
jgi:hypothetical protein